MTKARKSANWSSERGIPTALSDKDGKQLHVGDRLQDPKTKRIYTLINEKDEWNVSLILAKDMRWNDPISSFIIPATQDTVGKLSLVEQDSKNFASHIWASQKEFMMYCNMWRQ